MFCCGLCASGVWFVFIREEPNNKGKTKQHVPLQETPRQNLTYEQHQQTRNSQTAIDARTAGGVSVHTYGATPTGPVGAQQQQQQNNNNNTQINERPTYGLVASTADEQQMMAMREAQSFHTAGGTMQEAGGIYGVLNTKNDLAIDNTIYGVQ